MMEVEAAKLSQPTIVISSNDDDWDDEDSNTTMATAPKCIDYYMPLIFWHDKRPILSVNVQQTMPADQYTSTEGQRAKLRYKICTASVQHEVRVWELCFESSKERGYEDRLSLGVNFVANLVGHNATINMARYSPDGQRIASADVDGLVMVWKISPRDADFQLTADKPINDESAQFEIPQNKENWLREGFPIRHDADVNAMCFSPNSLFICTAAFGNLQMFRASAGRQIWSQRNFRRMVVGLAWDPTDRYIVAMSADRRLDLIDALKGHRLRTCYQSRIPAVVVDGKHFAENNYKLFFDQHVFTLCRTPDFSPCGERLFAPSGQLESTEHFSYGTYVFRRCDLDRCLPYAFYPCSKPTLKVSVAPVRFALRTGTEENLCDLPYRYIFAVMCAECVYFYDTQTAEPIGYVYDLSYDSLTDISWTPDAKVLAISSQEAFNIFLHVRTNELEPCELIIERCMSPPLKKPKEGGEK